MELDQFVENFAGQLEDTDASVFTPETKFKDLEEWTSFTALCIIAMADEEYNVKIDGNDIRNSSTVQDLFEIVKSKA